MREPLVSIITPCYNSEIYLERYLYSILKQTYNNVQLIIVNDGSVDSTEDIVLDYKEEFTIRGYDLTYVYQENKGLGGAINTGLKYIRGEYFTWCDSDNFLTHDYIKIKIDFFLANPQYSVVRCDGYIVSAENINKPLRTMAQYNTDKYNEKLFYNALMEYNFHFGCAMLKVSDFDIVNPQREIYPSREGQNWQLLLPMFYHYKSGYIDKQMFYFVIREDSISHIAMKEGIESRITQFEEYEKIICETIKKMSIPEEEYYLKQVAIKYAKRIFLLAIENNKSEISNKYYNKLKTLGAVNIKIKVYKLLWCFRVFRKIVAFIKSVIHKIKLFHSKKK